MASLPIPTTLPSVSTMHADIQEAVPALTVMATHGAINVLIAIVILAVGWMVARGVGRWLHDMISRSHFVDPTLRPLLANFARYAILAVTIVVVLGQFGVQTTSLIAILGATGLAIGLALQGTLSNVASGVMLLFLRPFRVHERIKVADATGPVREIGLFRTTVMTDDGIFVSIPNAAIFSGTIQNFSRETQRRANFTVEIDRAENLEDVQKAILDALARDPAVMKTPAPSVEVETLGPISTLLTVQAWVTNSGFGASQARLKMRVRQALQGADIGAPVPVAAPAVAPWTPQQSPAAYSSKKPN